METHIRVDREAAEVLLGVYAKSLLVTKQKIDDLRRVLGNGRVNRSSSGSSANHKANHKAKRKLSAAARKRIASAQSKRWAAYRRAKQAKKASKKS